MVCLVLVVVICVFLSVMLVMMGSLLLIDFMKFLIMVVCLFCERKVFLLVCLSMIRFFMLLKLLSYLFSCWMVVWLIVLLWVNGVMGVGMRLCRLMFFMEFFYEWIDRFFWGCYVFVWGVFVVGEVLECLGG